jgi:hypothetical protein
VALGAPLRPSRLAFSWTPDTTPSDPPYAGTGSDDAHPHSCPPRYTLHHLSDEEIEQWSDRIDNGYHNHNHNGYHNHSPTPSSDPPPPSLPFHPTDTSSELDFSAADEAIALENLHAADFEYSEDEDDGEMLLPLPSPLPSRDLDTEMRLPPRSLEIETDLQLPPGLHGPASGRRGRASYYLPRPPPELVDAASGRNSPFHSRPACEHTPFSSVASLSSSEPSSEPGLSLYMNTSRYEHGREHEREGERERAAVLLDSPTLAVPPHAVDFGPFADREVVVGVVGVPQDVGVGVGSGASVDVDVDVDADADAAFFVDEEDDDDEEDEGGEGPDMDVDMDVEQEREPSLSPSRSSNSDSGSVRTLTSSAGSDDLAEVAIAQIHPCMLPPRPREGSATGEEGGDAEVGGDGEMERVEMEVEMGVAGCPAPPHPPRNPSRHANVNANANGNVKDENASGTTGTGEVVAEAMFAY